MLRFIQKIKNISFSTIAGTKQQQQQNSTTIKHRRHNLWVCDKKQITKLPIRIDLGLRVPTHHAGKVC